MEYLSIRTIKKNPNNPRVIRGDGFKKLKESLSSARGKEHFEARPCIVSNRTGENIIIAGNTRYQAAKELGWDEIPVVVIQHLTEDQEREIIIRDNVSNGEWDWERLANEWDANQLVEWGLDIPESFDAPVEEAQEDGYDIPDEIYTDIVLGDIFSFQKDGKELHRLLCGDSTKIDDVEKLMRGEKADMVFTDPPYKLQTKGGCKGSIGKSLQRQGKAIEFISNFNPLDFLSILPVVFRKNMNAYIFCNKDLLPDYLIWARDAGYSFNVLVWKKPNAIPVGDSHRPDIEYLLLFRKNAIWNNGLKDVNYSRLIEEGRELGLHPTMKPIALLSNEMKISSNQGSIVVDYFLGSGSTMVAAHQLNRKCYGIELDPKYCQVIINRIRILDNDIVVFKNNILCNDF